MNSSSSTNISSGEANRSGTDIQGPLLAQDRNPSEMDTIEDLRNKLQKLEEKNLELTTQHNLDMSHYEKEIMKLRLELQRGEALLQVLQSEMSFARNDAHVQMYSAEDELCDAKAKLTELQAQGREPRHQRFRSASESQLDQSQSQDFRQMLTQSDQSIEAMRNISASFLEVPNGSFWNPIVPDAGSSPAAPDESARVPFESPPASARGESFWAQGGYPLAITPPGYASFNDDLFQVSFVPQLPRTPISPISPADDVFLSNVSPAASIPSPDESVRVPFVPQGVSTPYGPAPDARWEPRYRSYVLSGSDMPSGASFYTTCRSTPDARWEPRYRSYAAPGSGIPFGGVTPPSGGPRQGTYSMYGSDMTSDSLPSYFVPRGVSTPFVPASDASGRDQRFSYGSDNQFDQNYSQHFGPLRPPTYEPTDLMHYRSDTDLHSFWIPFKFSLTSIPIPSGKSGKTYGVLRPTNTYVNVMPSVIHTLSDLDFSSRIRPLSTFSMSVPSSPSMRGRQTGAGPASSVPSFRFRPRRTSSWPPVRTVSQGISNVRRHQEI